MERVVFVEILNRIGRVRERVRIDSFPATIGRAYTNTVIIDDKYVCPVHVRIALDDQGRLHAEDLGSKNGLYQVSPLKRRQRIEIAPDAAVRIGHTVLRFRGPDHAVPPAQAEASRRSNLPGLIENSYVSLGIFVLCLSAILFDVYLESSDSFTPANILGAVFFLLLGFAAWSGIWSFVNRLVAHRFRFLLHLSLAGIVIVLFLVVTTVFEYYSFLSSSDAFSNTIKLVSAAFVFFLLLLGSFGALRQAAVTATQPVRDPVGLRALTACLGRIRIDEKQAERMLAGKLATRATALEGRFREVDTGLVGLAAAAFDLTP